MTILTVCGAAGAEVASGSGGALRDALNAANASSACLIWATQAADEHAREKGRTASCPCPPRMRPPTRPCGRASGRGLHCLSRHPGLCKAYHEPQEQAALYVVVTCVVRGYIVRVVVRVRCHGKEAVVGKGKKRERNCRRLRGRPSNFPCQCWQLFFTYLDLDLAPLSLSHLGRRHAPRGRRQAPVCG